MFIIWGLYENFCYCPPICKNQQLATDYEKREKKAVKSKKLKTEFKDIKKNLKVKRIKK